MGIFNQAEGEGSVDRYKAGLVENWFTQTHGIDYQETFAPVAKMNFICVILSCSANLGWKLQQLDVTNAFLMETLKKKFIWKFLQDSPLKLRRKGT